MRKITKIEANRPGPFANPKLKVAAYCRVSTDSDEQLESLKAQTTHYEKHIKANPEWEYLGVYYDEGISGTKKEKEARERVIESLHREFMKWMDRFALTLNGSQELPRLLARAKAMADVNSAPEEVHRLFNYCQHMIELMSHIIRNR